MSTLARLSSSRNGVKTRFEEFHKTLESACVTGIFSREEDSLLLGIRHNMKYILNRWKINTEEVMKEKKKDEE